jgi:arsenite/tail-anchored protein-transporting ATPase
MELNVLLVPHLGESVEAMEGYYQRRRAGQNRWVKELKEAIDKVSASSEFKDNGSDKPIALTEVPFFDVELVGVPALYYLGSQCFVDNPNFSHLMEEGKFFHSLCNLNK